MLDILFKKQEQDKFVGLDELEWTVALSKNQSPHLKTNLFEKRFLYYDNILLNVMLKDRVPTHRVFSQLFQKNKASTVLKFLNEKTNFLQELAVMNSVPIPPFVVAAFDEMRPKKG